MTYSQELEAAREQVRIYQGALRRIRRTCKQYEDSDEEVRDYCYHQANAALIRASICRPGSPTEAGTETGTAETREAAG